MSTAAFGISKQKSNQQSSSAETPMIFRLLGEEGQNLGLDQPIRRYISGSENAANIGIPSSEDRLNFERRRLLEGIRPGLAARGLLTSGIGQDVENQALAEQAAKFGTEDFNRELSARQLSLQGLMGLLQTLLRQGTTTAQQGAGSSSGQSFNFGGSKSGSI